MSGFVELMAAVAAESSDDAALTSTRLPRGAVDWLLAAPGGATPEPLIDVGLADADGPTSFGSAVREALLDERHPVFTVRRRRTGRLRELQLLTVDGIGCLFEDDGEGWSAFGIAAPGELAMLAARWLHLRPVPAVDAALVERLSPAQFAEEAAGGEVVTVALRGAPIVDLLVRGDGTLRVLAPGDGSVDLEPIGPVDVLLDLERMLGAEWSVPSEA